MRLDLRLFSSTNEFMKTVFDKTQYTFFSIKKDPSVKFWYKKSPYALLSISYYNHVDRSRKRKWPVPDYLPEDLYKKFLNDPIYISMHNEWVSGGFRKLDSPSIDRIDPTKHYFLENIQLLTWKENHKKANLEKNIINSTEVLMFSEDGKFLKSFGSIKQASLETGSAACNIGSCCSGRLKNCGRFKWAFGNKVQSEKFKHLTRDEVVKTILNDSSGPLAKLTYKVINDNSQKLLTEINRIFTNLIESKAVGNLVENLIIEKFIESSFTNSRILDQKVENLQQDSVFKAKMSIAVANVVEECLKTREK